MSEIRKNIVEKLESHEIEYVSGINSDFEIELVKANKKWGSGGKKITYSSSILVDDDSKKVFYWEMTKESSAGLSMGAKSEKSFQMGKTLYRKEKSVDYGAEGKVLETSIDFGQISKMLKEVAKSNGYKFKVVLSKKKASY